MLNNIKLGVGIKWEYWAIYDATTIVYCFMVTFCFFWSCDLLILATFILIDVMQLGLLCYNVVLYSRLRYLHCVRSFKIFNRSSTIKKFVLLALPHIEQQYLRYGSINLLCIISTVSSGR